MSLPTKAVKAVIKNKEGKVLFLQRNPKKSGVDNWDLPGGLIEKGEGEEEALKRECLEELGVEIEVLKKSGRWKFFRDFLMSSGLKCKIMIVVLFLWEN